MKAMKGEEGDACRAWQLLMRFFFTQRGQLPSWGAEFGLSPVQCHVLHLIEPGRPLAMSPIAKWLLIGLMPQLTIWLWFTMAAGALCGAIAAAVSGRARRPALA